MHEAKKETIRWKEEVQTKVDEQNALKKEMIRVIQGTSGLDREMIQQMVNENKEALLIAQTNLTDSEKKLKEIEEQNQKAERNCSDLFTWASTYKGASFERRQAILKQFTVLAGITLQSCPDGRNTFFPSTWLTTAKAARTPCR